MITVLLVAGALGIISWSVVAIGIVIAMVAGERND